MIDFPPELDTPEFHIAWTSWETHRREIKKKLTPTSVSRQLASLAAVGVTNAIKTIELSIEKGWTGLFTEQICPWPYDAKNPPPHHRGQKPGKPDLYQGLRDFVGDGQ